MSDNTYQYNSTYGSRAILQLPQLKDVNYRVQMFSLPNVSFGIARQPTPLIDVPIPGDKLVFSTLNVTLLCDENLIVYEDILNWMIGMGFPRDNNQYRNRPRLVVDGSLILLSNHMNPIGRKIQFEELFPTSLTGPDYSSTDPDSIIRTVNVDFTFRDFTFVNE